MQGLGLSPFLPAGNCPCASVMATESIFSDSCPSPDIITPLFASFLPSDLSPAFFFPSLPRFCRCFLLLLAVRAVLPMVMDASTGREMNPMGRSWEGGGCCQVCLPSIPSKKVVSAPHNAPLLPFSLKLGGGGLCCMWTQGKGAEHGVPRCGAGGLLRAHGPAIERGWQVVSG